MEALPIAVFFRRVGPLPDFLAVIADGLLDFPAQVGILLAQVRERGKEPIFRW